MNNPFDYVPDDACKEAFRRLCARLDELKRSVKPEDISFIREIEAGKMLGVLIAADSLGERHTLYAFSGQLGDGGFYRHDFVGPAFDYLQPDGYFKRKEAEISLLNREILSLERGQLAVAAAEYSRAKEAAESEIREYKKVCKRSKLERDARRDSGRTDDAALAEMIRRSQFEKAELHRLKKRLAESLKPLEETLDKARSLRDALKEKRRSESEALQAWLFSNFRLLNARGESKSLSEIFAATSLKIPPSGAGECCAPKLLQAAYVKGWLPIAIAEFWYGKSKKGEVRIHGRHYPACRGKCLPVLEWMLGGVGIEPPLDSERLADVAKEPEILFENEWFCVVDKPAGMLSVPGKGRAVSLQQWLAEKYGADRGIKMAHRLDQDTSGLIIATFGDRAYKTMQRLFATRSVKKRYIADLEGDFRELGLPCRGEIDLPISPDLLDRPRQRIDSEGGKQALTEYEFSESCDGCSRVLFYPLTGRTHQLRVHAASDSGLGMPIVGDRLYGGKGATGLGRLHLHSSFIEFTFPDDGRRYRFESPAPF